MKRSLLSLLVATTTFAQVVPWTAETTSIPSTQAGDPTFVFLPAAGDAGLGLVIGTDTAQTGISLWSADGVLRQVVPVGLVNGADSRGALVLVTSSLGSLLTFEASGAGLTRLEPATLSVPSPAQVALAQNADGGFEVWVDTSSLTVRHYAMSPVTDGGVTYTALPSVTVPQVPSGLAVDDRTGRLYVGQPTLGVLAVERDGTAAFLISIDAGRLGPTVGGLDLFPVADGGALLFSTSPAREEVVLHAIGGSQATFRTTLQLGAPDGGSARARLPRFIDVYQEPIPGFAKGLLVVHDGVMANYKIVSLAEVDAVFPLPELSAPPVPDAGAAADAGADGGVSDGGVADGGGGTGGGAGGGGGGGGRPPGPSPGVEPTPPSCGCTGGPFAALPALLLLWWIRRLRSCPTCP